MILHRLYLQDKESFLAEKMESTGRGLLQDSAAITHALRSMSADGTESVPKLDSMFELQERLITSYSAVSQLKQNDYYP